MVQQVLEALRVTPGGRYCDATVGLGGHARHLLQHSAPDGQLVGLDRDPDAISACKDRLEPFGDRATLYQDNFAKVVDILEQLGMVPVDGLLLDLGVSSYQLDTPHRGFSFAADGPLDMRMDPDGGITAAELIARLSPDELARVIRDYGEERASKKIARAIKQAHESGELKGTADLARVVAAAVRSRPSRQRSKIHPATRSFMALRMKVNDELGCLHRFLDTFTEALRPGGRVAVISFHSLEDRAVKQRFANLARPCTCPPDLPVCGCGKRPQVSIVTRRPLRPSPHELSVNPRARSARLRVAERLA
jgi:16S rRNA (cytosine1402-N4)-methyltransferase